MDPNKFLTEFNEGGTHEENPLGGVPQGMGSNGKMNTVEEGETRYGDYVFSDRLEVTDDMIKKYNLPKNLKGKTFADASKIMAKLTDGNPNSTTERETSNLHNKCKEVDRVCHRKDNQKGWEWKEYLHKK